MEVWRIKIAIIEFFLIEQGAPGSDGSAGNKGSPVSIILYIYMHTYTSHTNLIGLRDVL